MWRKPCSAILSHCEFKVFDLQVQWEPCFKCESQHVNLTESLNLLMSIDDIEKLLKVLLQLLPLNHNVLVCLEIETMSAIMILLCIPFLHLFNGQIGFLKNLQLYVTIVRYNCKFNLFIFTVLFFIENIDSRTLTKRAKYI